MQAQPKFTPISTGAVIAHTEETKEITGYADVYVQLTESNSEEGKWTEMIHHIENWIDRNLRLDNSTAMEGIPELLKGRIDVLRRQVKLHTRSKRGLFDFVGKVSKYLFGTATEDENQAIQQAQRKLGNAVEGVVSVTNKIIGTVNHLGRTQVYISRQLNTLIARHNAQQAALEIQATVHQQMHGRILMGMRIIRIMNSIATFGEVLHERRFYNQESDAVRLACQAGIVNEQVVPLRTLQAILTEARSSEDPRQYYQYLEIKKLITTQGTDYCIVKVPLLGRMAHRQYTISTFPVGNKTLMRIPKIDDFIINPVNEELYYPELCYGTSPKACQPTVRMDKTSQPCYLGLISNDRELQKQCPLEVYNPLDNYHPVPTGELNKFVLRTTATKYHYRCPTTSPLSGYLPLGSYIIQIEPQCIFDATIWRLNGLTQTQTTLNTTAYEPLEIDLSWLDIAMSDFETKINMPDIIPPMPGMAIANYEEIPTLVQPKISPLDFEIKSHQASIKKIFNRPF